MSERQHGLYLATSIRCWALARSLELCVCAIRFKVSRETQTLFKWFMHNNTLWWFTRFHIHTTKAIHYTILATILLSFALVLAIRLCRTCTSLIILGWYCCCTLCRAHHIFGMCVWMAKRDKIDEKKEEKRTQWERNGKSRAENTMVLKCHSHVCRCETWKYIRRSQRISTESEREKERMERKMIVCRIAIRQCAEYTLYNSFVRSF